MPYLGLDDLIASKETYREQDALDRQRLLALKGGRQVLGFRQPAGDLPRLRTAEIGVAQDDLAGIGRDQRVNHAGHTREPEVVKAELAEVVGGEAERMFLDHALIHFQTEAGDESASKVLQLVPRFW